MSDPDLIDSEDLTERDEVAEVLSALRALAAKASLPFVRACLEEAHEDIAHLTGWDEKGTAAA